MTPAGGVEDSEQPAFERFRLSKGFYIFEGRANRFAYRILCGESIAGNTAGVAVHFFIIDAVQSAESICVPTLSFSDKLGYFAAHLFSPAFIHK